jgi:transposase
VGLNRAPGQGNPYRELTVASRERYEALKIAREREKTEGYAEEYRRGDGIEGTISLAVRRCGLRRTRYRGLEKVRLVHALAAAGLNFARVGAWYSGSRPSPARESPFSALLGDADVA